MTAHAHDPSTHLAHDRDDPAPAAPAATDQSTSTRPRWLVPALVAGIVVATLVAAGFLSLSTVLYAGLFGGMVLMHVGGHGGHAGHGSHGGGGKHAHGGHAGHGSHGGGGKHAHGDHGGIGPAEPPTTAPGPSTEPDVAPSSRQPAGHCH